MKKCSKCNTEFECGADIGKCWCMDFKVEPVVLDKLREDFKDCLCPKCLYEYGSPKYTTSHP